MARVSSTSRAPTPASSWVVICASTPRSTAASTASPSTRATLARAIASAITSTPVPVWRSRLIPVPPPNTAWSAPSVRATSSSRTSEAATLDRRPRSPTRRSTTHSCPRLALVTVAVEMVFIQFAGFTFGKSASAYATPWNGYPGNNNSFLMGGADYVTGVNNIQYTAQFGNGVSATIGLDDPTVFNRTAVWNSALGIGAGGTGTNAYGGTHAPDIVGNIRVDQAWGLFQISGMAHNVNATYNILGAGGAPTNLSEISGHPEDKWGGAVMAALQIKNLPTGAGDDFKIDVSYAKGDTKAVISTSGGSPSFAMFGSTGRAGAYQSIGFGQTSDAVYLPVLNGGTGDLKLVDSWGIRGAFNHNWDPYWSSSLWGSYASVRYNGGALDITSAKGQWCANYNAGKAVSADYSCNPDYNIAQIGLTTRWTPVKNLTFSAEVGAFFLDQKFTGAAVLAATAPKPTTVYEFKDQSTVFLNVRAQRNF